MSFISFLSAELRYHIKGYLANIIVVILAIIAIVFISQTSKASKRSIQLIMKNMGQNMVIISENTNLEDYYAATGKERYMPQDYIDTLSSISEITASYHVAILQKREKLFGKEAILTGSMPVKGAREKSGRENPYPEIKKGAVRLGSEIARETGLSNGASLQIYGKNYAVKGIEGTKGTMDDYRIYMDLSELQESLNLEGKITSILSLECLCGGEPLSIIENRIRKLVRRILPDVKLVTLRNIAIARYEARQVTDRYNRIILILIFVATFLFIVVQSYSEAAKKEKESALMSAIGFPHSITALMYICKALIVSIFAVLVGYILGQYLSLRIGPMFAKAKVMADYSIIAYFFPASFIVVIIGFIPAMIKSMKSDPFEILREE